MWITYPSDFEIWLGNKFNNRRTERGAMFPPFWKQDSHWVTVEFSTVITLKEAEEITIKAEGQFNFMLDGKLQFGQPETFIIPEGEHRLNFKVWNQLTPPALFVSGESIRTDASWLATYEDKIWIDENGVAHGSGVYVPAATSPYFQSIDTPPSSFALSLELMEPVSVTKTEDGVLYDFGRETMGRLKIESGDEEGHIDIYYGESREEALDHDHCETLDRLDLVARKSILLDSKAFRYVHISTILQHVTVLSYFEFLPQCEEKSGSFKCNDVLINDIWKVGAYTMDLTTREFFMDGIKRDRWTWSGDAIQSYLMNYYLRYDLEAVKRTIRQLRGKDPVTAHVNTIMDYTFYWFKSVLDFYQFSGDISFVREMYPRMQTLMKYCLDRRNNEGMMEGKPDDWIFVDWVDFPMQKRGVMCFEQILFAKSLETMKVCAKLLYDNPLTCPPQGSITQEEYFEDARTYGELQQQLLEDIDKLFWSNDLHAYMHNTDNGELNTMVTKFPNMFAMIFGYTSAERNSEIMDYVMLNPQIEAITTPYMRFYELEALCMMGMHNHVTQEIKDYWGGMLSEGATSFWEKYVPTEHGTQHLQMYGRPYGKSLCHAWGASPVYLFGRYYLGITPTKAGYTEWECKPCLGGLEWMEGSVPTPYGKISIKMDNKMLHIKSDGGRGVITINGTRTIIEGKAETTIQFS